MKLCCMLRVNVCGVTSFVKVLNGVIYGFVDYFQNEYEFKLNRLSAELQRHQNANIDYLGTGIKNLDVCKKASMPYFELSPK